jgi:cytochrome c peroxidase
LAIEGIAAVKRPLAEHVQTAAHWQVLPANAPIPANNPQTPDKLLLGERLFFDKDLSFDRSVACASCHELSSAKAGADGLPVSQGINGLRGDRNAPTVINSGFQSVFFWDGRAASLEQQALGPILNPVEMGMPNIELALMRLRRDDLYPQLFASAFPENPMITAQNLARALAAFQRSLVAGDAPYDRFVRGDSSALDTEQLRGMVLFQQLGCSQCHSGPNFSAASVFSTTHTGRVFPAHGRNERVEQRGLADSDEQRIWRVPSLRNVGRTAPYFHNGAVDSLNEAVRIMLESQLGKAVSEESGGRSTAVWNSAQNTLHVNEYQTLSAGDVDAIVAFLHALSADLACGPQAYRPPCQTDN